MVGVSHAHVLIFEGVERIGVRNRDAPQQEGGVFAGGIGHFRNCPHRRIRHGSHFDRDGLHVGLSAAAPKAAKVID